MCGDNDLLSQSLLGSAHPSCSLRKQLSFSIIAFGSVGKALQASRNRDAIVSRQFGLLIDSHYSPPQLFPSVGRSSK
ncbi:hypothetical protein [Variibacter gotjawalensis]|uniref:hypothetical protein n=1 Tax=Variibacter gotjawalensis TaxID=1333996 RepID=UPI000BBAFF04|nr:hypothetical protein [Variibacter gotjawalensis]NIK49746.1 hypothetical protein [Variibacter gotjawalensis]